MRITSLVALLVSVALATTAAEPCQLEATLDGNSCQCASAMGGPVASYLENGICRCIATQGEHQQPHIAHGLEVRPPFRYPWMATIGVEQGRSDCGATLIHPKFLLTAAHCLYKTEYPFADYFPLYAEIRRHNLDKSVEEENAFARRIIRHIPHPSYDRGGVEMDFAILELDTAVTGVNPVALDVKDNSQTRVGDRLKMLGWGETEIGVAKPQLQMAGVLFADPDTCLHPKMVPAAIICARGETQKERICGGDSGGPLFLERDDEVVQVGVISWAVNRDCTVFANSYFSKIHAAKQWISKTIA